MTQRQSLVEGFDNNCLNNAGNAVGGITIVLDNPAANYFAGTYTNLFVYSKYW